ncbi:dihydrofolate reductase [Mycoplasma putrefaciens]|uniref:dihydrofolate reductase n=1 Tax=Mycoplasma putrefaciens Mput9231 TaxID=1292033 RepID=M9WC93_9MOLU|nr:dihydrofolate reductase [Mycoplasma putrefaciens]AGJ90772.1 Dihydrofolate reductase [Mycoplasma putrefaciens Mput9231]
MIKLIWAQTKTGVIGKNNQLAWSIDQELQHFRKATWNKDIIMGRKTFASLNFQPLKNRFNYILTSDPEKYQVYQNRYDNLIFINDVKPIIAKYANNPDNELFVIGGKIIYEIFLDSADQIIRSIVKKDYQGDIYISELDLNKFQKISEEDFDEFYIERWVRK